MSLVSIRDLTVTLPPGADRALAVEGVSLEICSNEIVCIVGESGSGKSITAHAIMGLLPRSRAVAGGVTERRPTCPSTAASPPPSLRVSSRPTAGPGAGCRRPAGRFCSMAWTC